MKYIGWVIGSIFGLGVITILNKKYIKHLESNPPFVTSVNNVILDGFLMDGINYKLNNVSDERSFISKDYYLCRPLDYVYVDCKIKLEDNFSGYYGIVAYFYDQNDNYIDRIGTLYYRDTIMYPELVEWTGKMTLAQFRVPPTAVIYKVGFVVSADSVGDLTACCLTTFCKNYLS